MSILSFTVRNGSNPVPYKRTTQRQKFVEKGYKRYIEYKNLIVAEFVKKYKCLPSKILENKTKYYVNVIAYYKDKTHADTDNVAKGVNDAIFQKPLNDKYIAGSYDFFYDKEDPRLEITIKKELNE